MKPIIIRGGGDLATGVIHKLHRSGFKVIVLETEKPAAIRRQVSVCEAVYQDVTEVEGMKAVYAGTVTTGETKGTIDNNSIQNMVIA